jgi:hypothetical protein
MILSERKQLLAGASTWMDDGAALSNKAVQVPHADELRTSDKCDVLGRTNTLTQRAYILALWEERYTALVTTALSRGTRKEQTR